MGLQTMLVIFLAFVFIVYLLIDNLHRVCCLVNFQGMCEAIPIHVEKKSIWLKLYFNVEYLRTLHYFLITAWLVEGEPDIVIRDIDDIEMKLSSPRVVTTLTTIKDAFTIINPHFRKLRIQFKEGGEDGATN